MGSSKKHKEKDRERDKRDKDRKDRDKDRERRHRDNKEKDAGREKDKKERDRKRRYEDDDLLDYAMEESSRDEGGVHEAPVKSKSEGTSSLSIEETNKIRAKLGLKPLLGKDSPTTRQKESETTVASRATDGEGEVISIEATNKIREKLGLKPLKVESKDDSSADQTTGEDVHVPAINISEQESTRKFKERIAEMREKRKMQKKLSKVKSLGSSGDGTDNASSWIKKSRKVEKDKLLADKRAKLLEEMDEEFGIADLVEEEFGKPGAKDYSAAQLRGLKVQHSQKLIEEGQSVILTLKDASVLDEEGDILTNVNLVDLEKARKNVDHRKNKPEYNPYGDEFDEDGNFVGKQNVLSKYDEEDEDGNSFTLDSRGSSNIREERKLQKIRDHLKKQAQSLDMPAPKLAREFYTQEEMVQFKKPKKKRKVRKRSSLKADDLEIITSSDGRSQSDLGSRALKSILKHGSDEVKTEEDDLGQMELDGMDIDFISPEDDGEILGPDRNDAASLVEEDEAELELQMALERSRRLKKKGFTQGADKVAAVVSNMVKMENENIQNADDFIVLDSTSEFCRALGDIPSYGSAANYAEEDGETEDIPMEVEETEDMPQGGWERVKNEKPIKTTQESSHKKEEEDVTLMLSEEPVVGSGVASALELAAKKGLLEGVNRKVGEKFAANLPATKAIIDEEKMRDEERDRLRRERDTRMRDRPDRDSYRDRDDFNKGYKFDVKLEYVDDHGRDLSAKEAFRFLSHKFHGKTSGKMKTEKRSKKQLEEMKLKKMSTVDTPLNTVALLTKKQKIAQSPYLILSGGGKALSTTSLTKGK